MWEEICSTLRWSTWSAVGSTFAEGLMSALPFGHTASHAASAASERLTTLAAEVSEKHALSPTRCSIRTHCATSLVQHSSDYLGRDLLYVHPTLLERWRAHLTPVHIQLAEELDTWLDALPDGEAAVQGYVAELDKGDFTSVSNKLECWGWSLSDPEWHFLLLRALGHERTCKHSLMRAALDISAGLGSLLISSCWRIPLGPLAISLIEWSAWNGYRHLVRPWLAHYQGQEADSAAAEEEGEGASRLRKRCIVLSAVVERDPTALTQDPTGEILKLSNEVFACWPTPKSHWLNLAS